MLLVRTNDSLCIQYCNLMSDTQTRKNNIIYSFQQVNLNISHTFSNKITAITLSSFLEYYTFYVEIL